jgi:hypothetical protein
MLLMPEPTSNPPDRIKGVRNLSSPRSSGSPSSAGDCGEERFRTPLIREEFVSEELTPVAGTLDAASMSHGEPGLPERFTWRGREYRIAGLLRKWKTSGPCHHGSGEVYLRRHWYRILTEPRTVMTVYCERQARNAKRPKARWFIYTIEPD